MKFLHFSITTVALAALTLLTACQDNKIEPVAAVPSPIIQNNQLRYPANHPQLVLLVTTTAAAASGRRRVRVPSPNW